MAVGEGDDGTFGRAGRRRSFSPTLSPREQVKLLNVVRLQGGVEDNFATALRQLLRRWIDDAPSLELRTILLLVADLDEQGWVFNLGEDNTLVFEPPGFDRGGASVAQVKERVQRTLAHARARQLREPSVRAFIDRLERPADRVPARPTSVLDLVDDGASLAAALAPIAAMPASKRAAALRRVVDPVVELVSPGSRCEVTGVPLMEAWRYFRHTWAHEYRAVPGRQMMLLVRNAARPGRPVMGIAMLASPVMRLHARDAWIGWLRPAVEARAAAGDIDARSFLGSLRARVDLSIAQIRTDDLVAPDELLAPTEDVALRLQRVAYAAKQRREAALKQRYGDNGGGARDPVAAAVGDWLSASEDDLFVRKRAACLADLLYAKWVLLSHAETEGAAGSRLGDLLADPRGQRAVDVALTEFRKAGLSSQVADVSVCGAVPPYNDLLAGKLVALVLASREVRNAYAERYGGHVSVIASQMAGRPIVKPTSLRVLTTTSLYGTGSSQYNRLTLRAADHWGIPRDIEWLAVDRGLTGGFGTLHLGQDTLHALRQLGERKHASRRVNNRFGEGTSPRLRQVREGLDALGVESDRILHHATPRIFYGCELHDGARRMLLVDRPGAPGRSPSVRAIGEGWRRRWLAGRIANAEVPALDRIAALGPDDVRRSLLADDDGGEQYEMFG